MSKVMVTITGPDAAPTVAEVQSRYGLCGDEIDASFGVIEVDPQGRVYTVLVEESAAAKLRFDEEWRTEGPYSNPRIQPFGPPEG